ncbi:hypothetical protein FHS27_004926 [Rhodopirellula rubra]|uniref:Uncharacterized protein n=1 Tax=Aporhodopirellula rubra TaxID=980271 RepID=A0A7W5E2N0_9BACT|nr:hypothetical protein [Aporhodopirellula rubra]
MTVSSFFLHGDCYRLRSGNLLFGDDLPISKDLAWCQFTVNQFDVSSPRAPMGVSLVVVGETECVGSAIVSVGSSCP